MKTNNNNEMNPIVYEGLCELFGLAPGQESPIAEQKDKNGENEHSLINPQKLHDMGLSPGERLSGNSDSEISSGPGSPKTEFVNFVNFVRTQNELKVDRETLLGSTPTINDYLFDQMPYLLRETSMYFHRIERERDIFLTGAIGLLSACFPSVYGLYHGRKVFSNLNTFIAAPPASGKGVLTTALNLVSFIHKYKRHEANIIKEQIEKSQSTTKDDGTAIKPYIPEKMFLIPGNSSFSYLVKVLDDNNGVGVICETEADTLNTVIKQDWGNYSEMIRNATHHETIRKGRSSTGYVEINKPKLSVVLSGTPGQLTRFIPSTEDGLFSRFLYYIFMVDPLWSDPSPKESVPSCDRYFKKYANLVWDAYKYFDKREVEFRLSGESWHQLNEKFNQLTSELPIYIGNDFTGMVFRLGLFQYRLAMLFTILRAFEEDRTDSVLECREIDANLADQLTYIYLKHAVTGYNLLPKRGYEGAPTGCIALYKELPDGVLFLRKDAVEIGTNMGQSEGAVDKYLRKLLEIGYLISPGSGKYMKVQK